MSNSVSIIIPVYNQVKYTKQCIKHLFENTDSDRFDLIVVDNHSTDHTPKLLSSFAETVKVITNTVNMGFATACNQGAQSASGDYLLFLNNDTEVLPGWMEPLVETLESHPNIGAVGSKLLYPDGRLQHAGVIIIEQKNTCSLLPRHVFMGEDPAQCPVDQPMCFQALTAACLLVKKNEFIALGGFDEAYWNGCEDVDFCFRLQQIGKKLVYQPKSVVVHHESRSGQERQAAQPRNNARLRTKWDKLIQPDILQEGSISRRGSSRAVMPLCAGPPDSIEFLESAVAWWTNKTNRGLREYLRELKMIETGGSVKNQHYPSQLYILNNVFIKFLNSKRWQAGNAIIRFIERLSFRLKVPVVTDHMKEIINRFKMIRQCDSAIINTNLQEHVYKSPTETYISNSPPFIKTDIVICVHDALDDLKRCLDSVIRNTPESCRLILVNDGSAAETTDYLRQFASNRSKQSILLENSSALGYTRAANQGLWVSDSEHVILLNSDTITPKGWIDALTECVDSDSAIGIVGPLSNAASWQSVPTRFRPDGDWAVNELPEDYSVDKMAELIYRISSKRFPRVVFINGFCFLVKRSLIQSIGLLDEQAFPDGYGEENDYCLRAAKAGFGLAIADQAYVYHAKSKSYSHERRIELSRKGSKALAKKHGTQRINQGIESLRNQNDLAELRQRIRGYLNGPETGR